MKYTYFYKSSDGVRHEASMDASCREDVFTTLRKRGIKAIKVVAADGSRANGEIRGVRKRMVAVAIVITALIAGAISYFATSKKEPTNVSGGAKTEALPLPRQEIRGDRQRVNMAADAFELKAEKFLSQFAEPGRPFSADESVWPTRADFEESFRKPILFMQSEFTEQIDLKRIVAELKREMTAYLNAGGYVSGYIKELIKRQNKEIALREKASEQLDRMVNAIVISAGKATQKTRKGKDDAYNYWIRANAELQRKGIYPLPLPPPLADCQYANSMIE